ncbi:PstS family phosphate ABC transporter substrate-binding protein [Desulfatiferula olefinivorans]
MKRHLVFLFSAFMVFIYGLAVPVSAGPEFVLNAACSSQIAEAFQRELLERFMTDSGVKVKVHVFSSDVCLDRLRNGFSNLAGSTVPISQADRNTGMIEIPMCKDPMAVIVNPESGVTDLTLSQIRRIFSGSVTNWKDVGGNDLPVVRIIPAANTGACINFKQQVMGPFEISDDLIAGKTFTALTGVRSIPGSVSFIAGAIARKHKDITMLSVNGVSPGAGSYPFYQTFYMVLKGEPSPMMKEVIKYMLSDKARQHMVDRGMVPLLN